MNKKLVALAVAGAFALPLAAQAQTANVTLYGRINLDYEFVHGQQADGSNPYVNRLSSNSSRFGMRGTEALGGGLNAIFQLESSVSADASGGALAGRETFVGLQGGWGTFKAGNFLAPYDDIHPVFGNAPTLTTSIFSTAALWSNTGGPGSAKTTGSFDSRLGNSLRYDTPTIAGFNAGVQYSTFENVSHSYATSAAAFYNNGPISAGIAWEHNNRVRCYTTTGALATACGIAGVGTQAKDDAYSVAASWNFGIAKIGGVYERLDFDTSSGSLKRNFWGVSATVPLGPGRFYGFYGDANNGTGGASDTTPRINQIAHGADTGARQWELTYSYDLSKRTLLYGGYVQIQNDSRAQYSFNINPYAVAPGASVKAVAIGMVHFF